MILCVKQNSSIHISDLSNHYSDLFTSMGKGYLLIDELGQGIDSNEYFLAMRGISKNDPDDDPLDAILEIKENREYYQSVLEKATNRTVKIDGERYLEEGYPFKYGNGKYGIITLTSAGPSGYDHKQFYENVRIQSILGLIPDIVIVTDRDGAIVYVSPQFYKMYQTSFSTSFEGNIITSLFEDPFKTKLESVFSEIMAGREARNVPVHINREDGQILDGEISGMILSDEGNWEILLLFHDITEQVRVKEILLEEALLNASVARLSQDMLGKDAELDKFSQLFLDELLLLTSCSGGFIAEGQVGSGDIMFHAISRDLIHSQKFKISDGRYSIPLKSPIYSDFSTVFQDYSEGFYTNAPETDSPLQFFFEKKDPRLYNYLIIPLESQNLFKGQLLIYSNRGKRINEKEFEIVKRLGSIYVLAVLKFRKQNELEAACVRAEKANSAKNMLLSAMSTELNSPMEAIRGHLEKLSESGVNKKQKMYLKELQWCREELLGVISNVLEIARIESGSFELEYMEFDIFDLARSVWSESKGKALYRNIKVEMSFPKKLPGTYRGDESRIRKVLMNLIGYCIKYTKNDTLFLEFKERRRFNNTSEIEFRFSLSSGRLSPGAFVFSPDSPSGHMEIELIATKQIVDKLRGSIEVSVDADRVQSFLVTLPLFSIQ